MANTSSNVIQYFGIVGIESKLIPLKVEDSDSNFFLHVIEPYLVNLEIIHLPSELRDVNFVSSQFET